MTSHRYPSGAPAPRPGKPGSLAHEYDPTIPRDALRLPGGRRAAPPKIPPVWPNPPAQEETR